MDKSTYILLICAVLIVGFKLYSIYPKPVKQVKKESEMPLWSYFIRDKDGNWIDTDTCGVIPDTSVKVVAIGKDAIPVDRKYTGEAIGYKAGFAYALPQGNSSTSSFVVGYDRNPEKTGMSVIHFPDASLKDSFVSGLDPNAVTPDSILKREYFVADHGNFGVLGARAGNSNIHDTNTIVKITSE